MTVSKKAISRRTVLRGIGISLALPFLDSMMPALKAARKTAANPVRRFGVVYVPNGIAMKYWTPATEGKGFIANVCSCCQACTGHRRTAGFTRMRPLGF